MSDKKVVPGPITKTRIWQIALQAKQQTIDGKIYRLVPESDFADICDMACKSNKGAEMKRKSAKDAVHKAAIHWFEVVPHPIHRPLSRASSPIGLCPCADCVLQRACAAAKKGKP